MTNVPQPRPATAVTPVTQFVGSCAPQVRLFPDDPNSDPEHSFRPCSVPWFINQVQLVQGTSTTPPPLQALPVATASAYLAMPVGPTWQDNLAIRMGDLATATSYVYIRQVDELPGLWDLQYWLFYAVRGFSTARVHSATTDQSYDLAIPATLGIQAYQGIGEHQGDFKHVTVRIDTSGNIQGIYYAQHTKGVWCFPGEYETVADSNGNLHPVVYSARNTHSCLPHAGRFDQLGAVLPLPSTPVSSAVTFSLMEQTQDGGQYWNLWDNYTVVDNSPNPQWLQFLGHWGPTLNQASFLQDLVNSMVKALKINPIFGGPIAAVLERLLVWKQDGASTPRVQKPWINGDGLYTWTTVDPTHAWSTSGGPVSVVSDPDPVLNRLDVFICGQNGHVYNIGHTQGSGWDPQWGQVQPASAYSMSGGLGDGRLPTGRRVDGAGPVHLRAQRLRLHHLARSGRGLGRQVGAGRCAVRGRRQSSHADIGCVSTGRPHQSPRPVRLRQRGSVRPSVGPGTPDGTAAGVRPFSAPAPTPRPAARSPRCGRRGANGSPCSCAGGAARSTRSTEPRVAPIGNGIQPGGNWEARSRSAAPPSRPSISQ